MESLPKRDRGAVLSAIAVETQKVFTAAKSANCGISAGCVGGEGAGVTVTVGNVTLKACVRGTLESGPQGGGVEVSMEY